VNRPVGFHRNVPFRQQNATVKEVKAQLWQNTLPCDETHWTAYHIERFCFWQRLTSQFHNTWNFKNGVKSFFFVFKFILRSVNAVREFLASPVWYLNIKIKTTLFLSLLAWRFSVSPLLRKSPANLQLWIEDTHQ
jgi:hypothetical protein